MTCDGEHASGRTTTITTQENVKRVYDFVPED